MSAQFPVRPRLLHLTTVPETQWYFLRGQNRFLAEAGFELHSAAAPGPALDQLAVRDDVTVHPINMARRISPIADLRTLRELVRLFRRVRPHILHLSTPKAALLGAIAGAMARVPIRIFFVRGLISSTGSGFHRRLEKLTATLCHQTVFVSPSLRAEARAKGIVGPNAGIVFGNGMSNGIDITRFRPDGSKAAEAGGPTIGFVGRLVRDKGIVELARAWRMLREAHPTAKLLLVGDWEDRDAVPHEIRRELENDDRVLLPGAVDDVAAWYRSMDVFAFPSHREGFPNSPMEAAAMQLPVAISDAVGCRDAVIDGLTGTVVRTGDAKSLAMAVDRYLRDPSLAQRHGIAGRARVEENFSPHRIWEVQLETYSGLLHGSGLPAPIPAIRTTRAA